MTVQNVPENTQPTPKILLNTVKIENTPIARDLAKLGYSFRMNDLDDSVEVNGERINDGMRALILTQMRILGHKNMMAVEQTYTAIAHQNRYHPVREALLALDWDGQDHIARLAGFLADEHEPVVYADGTVRTASHAFLRRWLIGAAAKVITPGSENMMLVLAGPQGSGKSHLARWLCPLGDEYFYEGPIHPEEKDDKLRLANKLVWEVGELDATTRKQDVSALKFFVTMSRVTVRRPYGRHDITKPATASLIGTINPDHGGFLQDTTGNRRYMIVNLKAIDWNYAREIDINQVWAQAVALHIYGENGQLTPEETATQNRIQADYETQRPIEDYLMRYFRIEPDNRELFMPVADIINRLQDYGYRASNTIAAGRELAQATARLGLKKSEVTRHNGKPQRGYYGIAVLPVEEQRLKY